MECWFHPSLVGNTGVSLRWNVLINISNGCAPGSNAPNRKAHGAANSKGLMTDINKADSDSYGPTNQAPDGNAIANQIARMAPPVHPHG